MIADSGETGKRMYVYICIHRSKNKKQRKEGQHTNIVIIIIVIANSNLGVHNTPYKETTSNRNTKVNVIEDDIRSIVSAMNNEK